MVMFVYKSNSIGLSSRNIIIIIIVRCEDGMIWFYIRFVQKLCEDVCI